MQLCTPVPQILYKLFDTPMAGSKVVYMGIGQLQPLDITAGESTLPSGLSTQADTEQFYNHHPAEDRGSVIA